MNDPVITVDGHTFERKAIEEWFSRGNSTNPLTGKAIQSKVLIPNIALKNVIEEFLDRVPTYSKVVLQKNEEKSDIREIKKE